MWEWSEDYTPEELMVVCGAREIKDGDVLIVGSGMPLIAASLAKRTHAPGCTMLLESGVVDAQPRRSPQNVADCCLTPGAASVHSFFEMMATHLQSGHIDIGFLAGSQVDKYGNINSTCIGDYYRPELRLPGSGGASPIGCLARRVLIMMRQAKHRFVSRVDYITTPGYLDGPGARERAGLPPNTGPVAVISTMGLFRFDSETKEMYLESHHPHTTVAEVIENTDWELKVSPAVKPTPLPSEEEIRLIRQELDPQGMLRRVLR